jgi:hypothetical protein
MAISNTSRTHIRMECVDYFEGASRQRVRVIRGGLRCHRRYDGTPRGAAGIGGHLRGRLSRAGKSGSTLRASNLTRFPASQAKYDPRPVEALGNGLNKGFQSVRGAVILTQALATIIQSANAS